MTVDILVAIRNRLCEFEGCERTEFAFYRCVAEFGTSFVGLPRRTGFRQLKTKKQRFMSVAMAALDSRATYVEGLATGPAGLIHHAWLTTDAVHAIDSTWPNPDSASYFGIIFPSEALRAALSSRGHFGMLDPLDVGFVERWCPRV